MIGIIYGVPFKIMSLNCKICGNEIGTEYGLCRKCYNRFEKWRWWRIDEFVKALIDESNTLSSILENKFPSEDEWKIAEMKGDKRFRRMRELDIKIDEERHRLREDENLITEHLVEWLCYVLGERPSWLKKLKEVSTHKLILSGNNGPV